jgi:hypothetical protein
MAEQDAACAGKPVTQGPSRRLRRLLVLAVLLGAAALAACDGDSCENGTCVSESGMRLLDRVCEVPLQEGPACELEGAAEQTSGVTADTIGIRLGASADAEAASLLIHVKALEAATLSSGIFDVEILAAAREPGTKPRLTSRLTWGSCGQTCPVDPPPYAVEIYDEYTWVTVVADEASPGTTLPYDAVLQLSGSGIDIADMRSTAEYPVGCSIAGPLGSRR